jgi:hypothetical protein
MHVCIGSDQFFRRISLKVRNRPKMVCKTSIFFSVGSEISTELKSGTARVLVYVGQNQCRTRAPHGARVLDANTVL